MSEVKISDEVRDGIVNIVPGYLKEISESLDGVGEKTKDMELTPEESEAIKITPEQEEEFKKTLPETGYEEVEVDHNGNPVMSKGEGSEPADEIKLEDIKNVIEKSKEMRSEMKNELKLAGMSDHEIRTLNKNLNKYSEKQLLAMDADKIKAMLGKQIVKGISALQSDMAKEGTPKDAIEAKVTEMLRDLAVYYKQSMEFEVKGANLEQALAKDLALQEVEYNNIHFAGIYSESLLKAKTKLEDPNIEETSKVANEFIMYQLMDVMNLYTAKAYIKNKSSKGIRKDVKNFDSINKNIVKTLDRAPYVFTDPRATELAPAMHECIEHLLEDKYKKYAKDIYLVLFRQLVKDKKLEENKLYVYYMLKAIRVAYFGDFAQYQEKFTKSLNTLAEIYVSGL